MTVAATGIQKRVATMARWRGPILAVALLTAASLLALAAVGSFRRDASTSAMPRSPVTAGECAAPALPGSTVQVRLVDMRGRMTRQGMGNGTMLGPGDWRSFRHGMMRVLPAVSSAPAGTVSLRVLNTGYLTHELVVLPLASGQQPGTRAVGSDGTVEESGSLGEVSASCSAGAGEGIEAGSTGWLTLRLPAGRYELLCNLPGHYAAGMYAELDVR